MPTQSKVTLKRPRRQTLRQQPRHCVSGCGRKPSDDPPIKERSAYDHNHVVEGRETSELQEARSREIIPAEVKQKETP